NVIDEMAIHDVAMNPIGACGFDPMDFVTESREIGGKNGRSNNDFFHGSNGLTTKIQHSVSSALHYSHNIRLTALRTVSCYGVSGLAESRREKILRMGSA